jgi:hypothetical protein
MSCVKGGPMMKQSNFIVRRSGKIEGYYYIDSQGYYKAADIARISGIDAGDLDLMYKNNSTEYSKDLDVFYFGSISKAEEFIRLILDRSKHANNGKLIFFSEKELEYIRMALINEGSNSIHISGRVKDEIFKKLNS